MAANNPIPNSVKQDIQDEYDRQRREYALIAEKANLDVAVIETYFFEMAATKVAFFREKRKIKPTLFNYYQKKQRLRGIFRSLF
jgi:hypothetical protein